MTALSDLRAAVARADEVLGCGRVECRYKPQRDDWGLPGACQCGVIESSAKALEALYKAAKAVVEEQTVPVRGIDFAALEPYLSREVDVMGVHGTITEHRATASCVTPLDNTLEACWCFRCLDEPSMGPFNPAVQRMIVRPQCGNKRCPRATSHDNACTGSNEPGQDGSEK